MHALASQKGVSANKAAVLKVGIYRFTFRTDDSLLVEHEGGSASYAGVSVASSTSWGSGPVATVYRQSQVVKGTTYWSWQVTFQNGGYFRCMKRYAKRGNSHLNLWLRMPPAVASTASGLCATSCSAVPKLPYTSCGGEANCLPVRMSDTLFSSSIVTVRVCLCAPRASAAARVRGHGEEVRELPLRPETRAWVLVRAGAGRQLQHRSQCEHAP